MAPVVACTKPEQTQANQHSNDECVVGTLIIPPPPRSCTCISLGKLLTVDGCWVRRVSSSKDMSCGRLIMPLWMA
jgi:hypothetical protein